MTDDKGAVKQAFAGAENVNRAKGLGSPPSANASTNNEPPSGVDLHKNLTAAAGQPLNDYGNGQRVCIHFGQDLMFVPRVGWYTWFGTHWQLDPDNLAVRRKAHQLADLIEAEIELLVPSASERRLLDREQELNARRIDLEMKEPKDRTESHDDDLRSARGELQRLETALKGFRTKVGRIKTHAKNAGNNGPLKHMIEEAEPSLARDLVELDGDPLAVNTSDGLLMFKVTDMGDDGASKVADFEVVPHTREQLQTKLLGVNFNPKAEAPQWQTFLDRVQPDRERQAFLQRWYGLNMTGERIQRMVFHWGGGANGKSVLMDTLARIFGDYAALVRRETVMGTNKRGGGDATPDLIPLVGARSARAAEPEQGDKLQESTIKDWTGGEPFLVRALHGDFFEFDPLFKFTMAGNHKPDIRGKDDGIWRRVLLVPWDEQIPEAQRDPHLVEKLVAEGPGILNWLIEGLLSYLEIGLDPPQSILEATNEYREESDPVGLFLVQCCRISGEDTDTIRTAELVQAFNFHMMERGDSRWKERTIQNDLTDKARRWRHPETGLSIVKGKASISQYHGLSFAEPFATRWKDAIKDVHGRALGTNTATPDPDDK